MADERHCPVVRTADIVCGKWTLLVIRDLAEGRCALLRARALARRHQPAHALAAPARARGGGHRRAPHVPRGPAARRVRADREGPRAAADHRGHARLRQRWLGGERPERRRRARGRRSRPSPPPDLRLQAACAGRSAARAANAPRHAQPRPPRRRCAPSPSRPPAQLAADVAGGAEVPFELIESRPRPRAPALLLPAADRRLHRASASACSRACPPTRRPRARWTGSAASTPTCARAASARVAGGPRRARRRRAARLPQPRCSTRRASSTFDGRALRARLRRARGRRLREPRAGAT